MDPCLRPAPHRAAPLPTTQLTCVQSLSPHCAVMKCTGGGGDRPRVAVPPPLGCVGYGGFATGVLVPATQPRATLTPTTPPCPLSCRRGSVFVKARWPRCNQPPFQVQVHPHARSVPRGGCPPTHEVVSCLSAPTRADAHPPPSPSNTLLCLRVSCCHLAWSPGDLTFIVSNEMIKGVEFIVDPSGKFIQVDVKEGTQWPSP